MDKFSFQVQWSDEDQAYVAICPEFPGVSALGPTVQEALAEAQVALEAAVETYDEEGWKRPTPLHSLRHSGQFRLRVPHSLHSALVMRADAEGVSLNTLAVTYLANGIGAAVAESRAVVQCERTLHEIREMAGEFPQGLKEVLASHFPVASWNPVEFNTTMPLKQSLGTKLPGLFSSGPRSTGEYPHPETAHMPLSKVLAA